MVTPARIHLLTLVVLFVCALFLRTYDLGGVGFSEDEANKILAVQEYLKGKFTANAEHPMLMKVLALASLQFSSAVHEIFPPLDISPEAAVRFPAALAGAAAVFAIYLLARELFSPSFALIAATLWAFDINSVALSRIAKEDALAALFFVLGNFFLLQGKRFHFDAPDKATLRYMACGIAFGLMFASKYLVPLVWITLIFYDVFRFGPKPLWRLPRKNLFALYGCFILTFLLFNPVILRPAVWEYIWKHFTHERLTHHGYYMMGELFTNAAYHTFWGTPFYFFPLFILTRTPLPLLLSLAIGMVYATRRIKETNFLFLCLYFFGWLFLLSLPGGKFTRYAMTLWPSVIMLEALGVYLVWKATAVFFQKRGYANASTAIVCVLLAITAGWQLSIVSRYLPHASMYVAWQGGGKAREGYYFPQDDFYDAGLRESVLFLCNNAPRRSDVVGATPAAFRYYATSCGRTDIQFVSMAGPDLNFTPDWHPFVIAQDYRTYLENYHLLTFLHSQMRPLHVSTVRDQVSVTIYRMSSDAKYAASPFDRGRHWPANLRDLGIKPSSDAK